jgi:ketosteroid isomerase-like protein
VPSANVELVRSIHACWERGDYSSADWADPDIEYVIADGPSPGKWTGLAAMAEGWRDVLNAFEAFRGEAEDFRELDKERVIVLSRLRGRGKTSGVELGQVYARAAMVFYVRADKVTRVVVYFDRDRAFAELGLTPEAGSPAS